MRRRREERIGTLVRFAARHQAVFWALHSLWALGWGVAFVLLGKDRPHLLRWGLVSVGAVWATSLLLPAFLAAGRVPPERREAVRRLVLWGQKWLLQGLAFFLLPLYHRSTTYASGQAAFMALLALAALAATIDVVYDEVVARRPFLLGVLLAFVAFATLNVSLPMVWRVGGLGSLVASGLLATVVFASFVLEREEGRPARAAGRALLVGVSFLALVTFGRSSVPPAPLRLVTAHVGTELTASGLDVAAPLASVPGGERTRLVFVAAVQAPAGLDEGVRHVWSVNGRVVFRSRVIEITGGRGRGFRSRSAATLRDLAVGERVRIDVETARGQLIGRAELPVRPAAPRTVPARPL